MFLLHEITQGEPTRQGFNYYNNSGVDWRVILRIGRLQIYLRHRNKSFYKSYSLHKRWIYSCNWLREAQLFGNIKFVFDTNCVSICGTLVSAELLCDFVQGRFPHSVRFFKVGNHIEAETLPNERGT